MTSTGPPVSGPAAAAALPYRAAKEIEQFEAALTIVQKGIDGGLQPGELLDQLAAYWRDLMVVNSAESATGLLESSPAQVAAIRKQAAELNLDTILAGLDVLQTAKYRMSRGTQNRVLLELAVVRLSRLAELISLSDLANVIRSPESSAAQAPQRPSLRLHHLRKPRQRRSP